VKWRCEWCGKPHPENDPPCDNCGHGEFEKAVVPAAPAGDEQTSDAYGHVWVCTECGNDHPKNTPPCDRCGNTSFERQEIEFDEEEVMSEMLDDGRSGSVPSADVSYLDVLDAKLVLAFVGVAVVVAIFSLGFLGIFDPLGLFPGPNPADIEAPGNESRIGSLDVAGVEESYITAVNERRADAGRSELVADASITSAASYLNKKRVQSIYGEETTTPSPEVLGDIIGDSCDDELTLNRFQVEPSAFPDGAAANADSERALADTLVENRPEQQLDGTITGVDVHLGPDGTVFVTQLAC
jgi:predicted nucleic-acid-binding Zn-ribbon protein